MAAGKVIGGLFLMFLGVIFFFLIPVIGWIVGIPLGLIGFIMAIAGAIQK